MAEMLAAHAASTDPKQTNPYHIKAEESTTFSNNITMYSSKNPQAMRSMLPYHCIRHYADWDIPPFSHFAYCHYAFSASFLFLSLPCHKLLSREKGIIVLVDIVSTEEAHNTVKEGMVCKLN